MRIKKIYLLTEKDTTQLARGLVLEEVFRRW
jgi:hypothetical protein